MYALASLSALMPASVPELTNRTRSIDGMLSETISARRFSRSVGAPKLVPRPAASVTAATTSGWAWPSTSGPHEQT